MELVLGKVRLVETGKRTVRQVMKDDVGGLAAELAYRFLLALFPFFIFLAALGGFVAEVFNVENPTDRIMDLLEGRIPSDAASVLSRQLEGVVESQNPGLLSIGILGAVWAASGGVGAVIKAMNRAYDVQESRPFWRKYALQVGLTLLAGTFIIGAFALLLAGQIFGQELADALGVGGLFALLISLGRWPVVIALLLVAVAFLYWAAPNAKLPFKWITPGSVLFTVVWLAATYGFGLYVAHFGSYNATYGALGGVVILLVWLYLSAFILLVGAELNAVLEEQAQPDAAAPRPGRAERDGTGEGKQRRPRPGGPERASSRTGAAGRLAALAGVFLGALALWRWVR